MSLNRGLDDLRHRGGGHLAVALGVAPGGGQTGHQHHRRGQHPHTGGSLGVVHHRGEEIRPKVHDQGAEQAHREEEKEGDLKDLVGLIQTALDVGLGDHLGHCHRYAGGGDG